MSSCKNFATKLVPKSDKIVLGMQLCWKKIETSAFAIVQACADVKGIVNKYLEKTSMPDETYLEIGDWNGPTKSVCIISPEKSCS